MNKSNLSSFETWLNHGIQSQFCSHSYCYTHDQGFLSQTEREEFEHGNDPCIPMVKLLGEPPIKKDSA